MRAARRARPYTPPSGSSTAISHPATVPRVSRAGIGIGARGGRTESTRSHHASGAAIVA